MTWSPGIYQIYFCLCHLRILCTRNTRKLIVHCICQIFTHTGKQHTTSITQHLSVYTASTYRAHSFQKKVMHRFHYYSCLTRCFTLTGQSEFKILFFRLENWLRTFLAVAKDPWVRFPACIWRLTTSLSTKHERVHRCTGRQNTHTQKIVNLKIFFRNSIFHINFWHSKLVKHWRLPTRYYGSQNKKHKITDRNIKCFNYFTM